VPEEKKDSTSLQTMTSTALLEGLKAPDNSTVWLEFDNRDRPMITRYARRFGLTDQDAQDAAQQTLIAFCDSYRQGKYDRDKGRLRIWLFGIARNQILNTRRKKRGREVQVADASQATGFFDKVEDEDQLEQAWNEEWRQAVLRQCLEAVRKEFDGKTVEAFELFAWKGLPAQEVAEQLGMTANAVFLVKHRVMKRIRELLPAMEDIW
jgi:RNA polymerase sigma-70 factor, ECF subfamily